MKNIILLLIVLLFISCVGTKKIHEKTTTTKQTEKIEIKKDSSKIIKTNKAVSDKIVIPVPSVSPEVDAQVDEVLSKLNTSKTSGSNSYHQKYNKEKREIVTKIAVAETKDVTTNTNASKNTEKTFDEKIDNYIYKKIKVIPWWVYGIIAFLFRNQLIGLLSFFFPGIKTIKTIKDFKKKLTPKIRSPVE